METYVDDVEFTHDLGVCSHGTRQEDRKLAPFNSWPTLSGLTVVLTDSRSGRDIILDLVECANPGSVQIHDRTTRLDQVSLGLGTSRKTISKELFVFTDEVLELTFLGGQCVELVDVELSELFDVDRSTVLRE